MRENFLSISSPFHYEDVTPSDTANFTRGVAVGILVTVSGNVACVRDDGGVVVFPLTAGIQYAIACRRINSTSTTATGIKAFFESNLST